MYFVGVIAAKNVGVLFYSRVSRSQKAQKSHMRAAIYPLFWKELSRFVMASAGFGVYFKNYIFRVQWRISGADTGQRETQKKLRGLQFQLSKIGQICKIFTPECSVGIFPLCLLELSKALCSVVPQQL